MWAWACGSGPILRTSLVDGAKAEGLRIETGFGGSVGGDFNDAGGSRGGDFGRAFNALHDEGAGPVTALHESDDAFDVRGVGDADDVVGGVGEVVEFFEAVEDGA